MASKFGTNIITSIFGQSHSEAIGCVIDGLPAGFDINMDELGRFMKRRAPGQGSLTTPRKEADEPIFLSGLFEGKTCGAPLGVIIKNTNTRSADYSEIADKPRPAHADLTAHLKWGGYEDYRGGGHFSGRLTAPLCAAGGIFLQMLEGIGVTIHAELTEVGGETDPEKFASVIENAKAEGDSVGAAVTCRIHGLPAGIGDPMFDGIENRIALAVFGIPAVKGVEFGAGFGVTKMQGSQNNDPIRMDGNGRPGFQSNNSGGILGGISDGDDIVFRAAFKPTPSIAKEQDTISWSQGGNARLQVRGRHDPCVAVRAVPVVEAAAAMAVADMIRWTDVYPRGERYPGGK